jgi:uncharacterized protein (DUF2147 family)
MLLKLLAIFILFSASQKEPIEGIYLTQKKHAKLQIYTQNNKLYGKVIWLKESMDEEGKPRKDTKNPDKNLRSQAIMGLLLVKGLEYQNGKWQGGDIYDPERGRNFTCELWLEPDGKTLKVRGYLGFFYETQEWLKIE